MVLEAAALVAEVAGGVGGRSGGSMSDSSVGTTSKLVANLLEPTNKTRGYQGVELQSQQCKE